MSSWSLSKITDRAVSDLTTSGHRIWSATDSVRMVSVLGKLLQLIVLAHLCRFCILLHDGLATAYILISWTICKSLQVRTLTIVHRVFRFAVLSILNSGGAYAILRDHRAYLDLSLSRYQGPMWVALTVGLTTLMASTELFAHINGDVHRRIVVLDKPIWLMGPQADFDKFELIGRSTINFELTVMVAGPGSEFAAWVEDLEGNTVSSLKVRSRLASGKADLGPGRYYLFTKAKSSAIFPLRVSRFAWYEADFPRSSQFIPPPE